MLAQVGQQQRLWSDPARQAWGSEEARPLRITLWYPAEAGARLQTMPAGPFATEPVAPGAAPAASPQRLPLLLLSHGTGGSAMAMSWLGQALAAGGHLVAAIDHHGNSAAEGPYRLEAFIAWWDRPRDLSVALDRLLADPAWGARIDSARIGVLGFSLGGYTALATLGARLDPQALERFLAPCLNAQSCRLPPEAAWRFTDAEASRLLREQGRLRASLADAGADWRDARIRAGLALAPVHGALLTQQSLAAIRSPVHLIASEADEQAPPSATARPVAAALPGATLHVLTGVAHYGFLSPCTPEGRQQAAAICSDAEGPARQALHPQLAAEVLAFFARALPAP